MTGERGGGGGGGRGMWSEVLQQSEMGVHLSIAIISPWQYH